MDVAELKSQMAKAGFDVEGIDKSLQVFLERTREQTALAGIKATYNGHAMPGFLCATKDYIIFTKISMEPGKAFFWPVLRQDAHLSDWSAKAGVENIYLSDRTKSSFFLFTANPTEKDKFLTYVNHGRLPYDPLPPL